ncbi:MAG: haloacid dehalogenase type II [Acetobacteraceae bacterium]
MVPSGISALTFDVFGTVVDWREGIAREAEALLGPKGYARDWGVFADRWRLRYQPALERVRQGARPWTRLDDLHRENLIEVLQELDIPGLDARELDELNRAWHRLDPWPDVTDGLARLKPRFILAALSNGNVALMVNLARHAHLPWDVILGAELARAYKPQAQVYDSAATLLDVEPRRCMMVAAHEGDLVAARGRGFRTAFVGRPDEHGRARSRGAASGRGFDIVAADFCDLAAKLGC